MADNGQSLQARFHHFERLEVVVEDFAAQGPILDVGGGGEGAIGRLKGSQVVAIDSSRRELEEAPAGPLKVVMDARDLQFLDGAFSTATAFFSLMFVKGADHAQVFAEVYRVLAPGGRFLVWDLVLPPQVSAEKDVAVFPLLVHLPGETVETGYGTLFPRAEQGLPYYVALAGGAGFQVASRASQGRAFFLELLKPS